MSETMIIPLADVLDFREGPGILAKDFHGSGVPLIRLAGLKPGAPLLEGCNYLDATKVATKWNHFRLAQGDVLLSTSASLGEVAVVSEEGVGAIPYTGIIRFRPKDDRVVADFIQFALQSPSFKQQIVEMGVGSVMSHFGPTHLKQMTLRIPSASDQRAIAEVLGALDAKIAANTALGVTSDQLVRAEYARLEACVDDRIPIGDFASHPRTMVDPTGLDANVRYVGLEHVPRRNMWLTDSGTAGTVTSAKAQFAAGDVLFGKLRPYFHKVIAAPDEGICSTDILVLRARDSRLAGYLLAAASSDRTIELCTAASEGTRMPRTSWKDLAAVEVPWPGATRAAEFSTRVAAVGGRVVSAVRESTLLAATRDALLPGLMSGTIRVKDAERVVEEAV